MYFTDEVYIIYKLCAYDKILSGDESFWCDLLTSEQRDVLEYGRDLEVSQTFVLIPMFYNITLYVYPFLRFFKVLHEPVLLLSIKGI